MKSKELARLGIARGEPMALARAWVKLAARGGMRKRAIRDTLSDLVENPAAHVDDSERGALARALLRDAEARTLFVPRDNPATYRIWGDDLEPGAIKQMDNACALPIAENDAT